MNKRKEWHLLLAPKIDFAILPCSNNHVMIIVLTLMIANITQSYYNNLIHSIDTLELTCPCCKKKGMDIHGYYNRKIKNQNCMEKLDLRIRRVICRNEQCGSTSALLPSSIVPYSQISMVETIDIINAQSLQDKEVIMQRNPLIDYNDILLTTRNFKKKWRRRLAEIEEAMGDESFFVKCISFFSVHFMQIPDTVCGSYSCHHTVTLALPL